MKKPHATVSNSWASTKVVCLNHEAPLDMKIAEVKKQMVYLCQDAENPECRCRNCLTVNDFNKMLDHINDKIVAAALEDRQVLLTNYTWKDRNGIRFRVLEHTEDHTVVGVMNTKAIQST